MIKQLPLELAQPFINNAVVTKVDKGNTTVIMSKGDVKET